MNPITKKRPHDSITGPAGLPRLHRDSPPSFLLWSPLVVTAHNCDLMASTTQEHLAYPALAHQSLQPAPTATPSMSFEAATTAPLLGPAERIRGGSDSDAALIYSAPDVDSDYDDGDGCVRPSSLCHCTSPLPRTNGAVCRRGDGAATRTSASAASAASSSFASSGGFSGCVCGEVSALSTRLVLRFELTISAFTGGAPLQLREPRVDVGARRVVDTGFDAIWINAHFRSACRPR